MTVNIRTMSEIDLKVVFALKEQAGWNQTLGDLERFRRLAPEGCFLAELGVAPYKFPDRLLVVKQIPRDLEGRVLRDEILRQV